MHRSITITTKLSFISALLVIISVCFSTAIAATVSTSDDLTNNQPSNVHEPLFNEQKYPSAFECKTCHELQFRQWSLSPHSYAQLSPAFTAQHIATIKETNGTAGAFCARCHDPVGSALSIPVNRSNMDREQHTREGVTCIVCHRQNKRYGKGGQLVVQQGDIFSPVFGPSGNEVQKETLEDSRFLLTTTPDKKGRAIHNDIGEFFTQRDPAFCGICHSVRLPTGLHTEETYDEYKTSQSAKDGVSCTDCHNGKVPGENKGFDKGPAAVIGEHETKHRRISNHYMGGPDFSVLHPGIFPHNPDAVKLANYRQWLAFDYKAGWGTDEFEDNVEDEYEFPEFWADVDLRYEASTILEEQFNSLSWALKQRDAIMKAGYGVEDLIIEEASLAQGLQFKLKLKNLIDGHNVPTGFIHERMVFFEVIVKDPQGNVVFLSGDRDPNGDLRDLFSNYVRNGELTHDKQLFNLQSKFIIKNSIAGERQQVHFIPVSAMPTPFVRPPINPTNITSHPNVQRIDKHSIEPGGHRWANYDIDPSDLTIGGGYDVQIRLISQPMPGYFLKGIADLAGLDYNLSLRELVDRIVDTSIVLWETNKTITVQNLENNRD
ncbi:multiheme c-type cytochrome [Colwellia sp. KU-HH00111]|uniref:multiheme c-type cytochrome n=1 Tax=Colwellia sp. KU-HH00111 TaxID=3127652 RepID=UPI00310716CF